MTGITGVTYEMIQRAIEALEADCDWGVRQAAARDLRAALAQPEQPKPTMCEWTHCPTRVGDVCCHDRLQAEQAAQQGEPKEWSVHIAGLIATYLGVTDEAKINAVAGIIERRRWQQRVEGEPMPELTLDAAEHLWQRAKYTAPGWTQHPFYAFARVVWDEAKRSQQGEPSDEAIMEWNLRTPEGKADRLTFLCEILPPDFNWGDQLWPADAEHIARAVLAIKGSAVPIDWQLVPVRATPKMEEAAYNAERTGGVLGYQTLYAAMLAAAPKRGGSA